MFEPPIFVHFPTHLLKLVSVIDQDFSFQNLIQNPVLVLDRPQNLILLRLPSKQKKISKEVGSNDYVTMWRTITSFFGFASKGTLLLKPDASAVEHVSGFRSGVELRVPTENWGTTVGHILAKLNHYRGPDQQLRHVWFETGEEVPMSCSIEGELIVVVRAASILEAKTVRDSITS